VTAEQRATVTDAADAAVPVVRPMRGRHISAVRAIDTRAYSRPWSLATWRRELDAGDRTHLVAQVRGRVIGHAGSLTTLRDVHVTTVAVDPDVGSRGVATRMVLELLRRAEADGAHAATLEVRATHRRTQRLYARLGFAPVGTRPRYYAAPTEDAVIMWLHDLAAAETRERWAAVDEWLAALPPVPVPAAMAEPGDGSVGGGLR